MLLTSINYLTENKFIGYLFCLLMSGIHLEKALKNRGNIFPETFAERIFR